MDYRSALHDSGNYELIPEEKSYHVPDTVWHCKLEEEKKDIFTKFLLDSRRKQKAKSVTSKDGKFGVVNTVQRVQLDSQDSVNYHVMKEPRSANFNFVCSSPVFIRSCTLCCRD